MVCLSSVVTTGKLYSRPLFNLVRLIDAKGPRHSGCRVLFFKAFDWWKGTLECWISGSLLRSNVRVISSQLMSDSMVMQQDAGDEGLGYFWVSVKDEFKHLRFEACLLPAEDDPSSSTFKELSTLAWALPRHPEWLDRLLVVIFDSSACFCLRRQSRIIQQCLLLIAY